MTRGSTASAYPYFRRPGHGARTALLLAALVGLASQSLAQRDPGRLSAEDRAVLERISAASLRGHLSFLASDTLAGRDTPSPGLDVAAEYIAAQFRRAGLQPGGDDGYFQTANWIHRDAPRERARAELQAGDQAWVLAGAQIGFTPGPRVSANLSQPVHVTFGPENNPTPGAAQIRGNAVVTRFADPPNLTQEEAARHFRIQAERLTRLRAAEPQLIVILQPRPSRFPRFAPGRLLDPENPQRPGPEPSGPRVVALTAPQAAAWLETQPAGNVPLRVALECPAVEDRPVRLRNVVGVLPGSDPALRDTYVLVSAHYDHIGVGPEG
ncbi:MAG: hypothetical protein FJX77_01675, partial [Armatimonadetes bacterium]|nr:hypothetical protein [Armatimonadota bacterium]